MTAGILKPHVYRRGNAVGTCGSCLAPAAHPSHAAPEAHGEEAQVASLLANGVRHFEARQASIARRIAPEVDVIEVEYRRGVMARVDR